MLCQFCIYLYRRFRRHTRTQSTTRPHFETGVEPAQYLAVFHPMGCMVDGRFIGCFSGDLVLPGWAGGAGSQQDPPGRSLFLKSSKRSDPDSFYDVRWFIGGGGFEL